MNTTPVTDAVEITRQITAPQQQAIERLLGERPTRFTGWAETAYFQPQEHRADTPRRYLRAEAIAHRTGRQQRAPQDTPASSDGGRP